MNNYYHIGTDEPSKPAPLPKRFKIKYSFQGQKFDYALPILGVDVEFLKARREEVRDCFAQLSLRIGKINIVTSTGVAEMDTAAKLSKYYFYASKLIERKYLDLTVVKRVANEEERLSNEKHMREMYRERTS